MSFAVLLLNSRELLLKSWWPSKVYFKFYINTPQSKIKMLYTDLN